MTRRMTADQRHAEAAVRATEALAAIRAGNPAKANALLTHAVHDGVPPVELVSELIAQTGGKL